MGMVMTSKFDGKKLTVARNFRGLTQKALFENTQISQGLLSKYEACSVEPSDESITKIAAYLKFPAEFFSSDSQPKAPVTVLHRKTTAVSAKDRDRLQAIGEMLSGYFNRIYQRSPWGILLQKQLEEIPENAAAKMRHLLGLQGPIDSVINAIEQLGIIVVPVSFGDVKTDGFTMVSQAQTSAPVVVINSDRPGDRQRASICHELGHLVLHEITAANVEADAWRFAAEFLLPAKEIEEDLRWANANLSQVQVLKKKWKASMAMLLKRSYSLGIISESQYTRSMMQMAPYRVIEPVAIVPEKPLLAKKLIIENPDVLTYWGREVESEVFKMVGLEI